MAGTSDELKVGVIGLGKMGGPIAYHLYRKGLLSTVFARTTAPEWMKKNNVTDIQSASSPKDLASKSTISLLAVPIAEVRNVIFGESGVASGLPAGGTVIDTGNSDYRPDAEYHSLLKKQGRQFIDAAVSGGPKRARSGELVSIIGGENEAVEAAMDVFRAYSKHDAVFHIGGPGRGHEAKMYHNQDEQLDMRNMGEIISLLLSCGIGYSEAVTKLNSLAPATLLRYAAMVPEELFHQLAPKIGGGDLPQIAVATAQAMNHPTPLTDLMLGIRKLSRGEKRIDQIVSEIHTALKLNAKYDVAFRFYNLFREKIDPGKIGGSDESAIAARALATGYLVDLAEVVSIAHQHGLNVAKAAEVFRAGLCDKEAVGLLLKFDGNELKEFDTKPPTEDKAYLEDALQLFKKQKHAAPSTALYSDVLFKTNKCTSELQLLKQPKHLDTYGNAIRTQVGIRDAFGEHGFEIQAKAT